MNVFEDEDYKPPWKAMSFATNDGEPCMWDVISDRENLRDSYSITEELNDNEKLCRLWAKSPELLELCKYTVDNFGGGIVDKMEKLIREIES